MTKITVEIEPVLLQGTLTDKQYYGFRIIGLQDCFGYDLVVRSSDAVYPGNDAVREFINSKIKEQS